MKNNVFEMIDYYFEDFIELYDCLEIHREPLKFVAVVRSNNKPILRVEGLKTHIAAEDSKSTKNTIRNYISDKKNATEIKLNKLFDNHNKFGREALLIENFDTGTYYKLDDYITSLFLKTPTVKDFQNVVIQKLKTGYNEIMKLFSDTSTPEISEPTNANDEATNEFQQQITIPDEVLQWLQTTISENGNGKAYIEKCNGKYKWLQNKQLARVLLTHEAIRGNLSIEKAILQAPIIFIYGNNNAPLKLGNNDTRQENANNNQLRNYLNGLKKPTT